MTLRKLKTIVLIVLEAPTNPSECWGVIIPHISGCHTTGNTREEALANAKEVIPFHTKDAPIDSDYILNDQTSIDMRQYGDMEAIDIEADVWVKDTEVDGAQDTLLRKITAPIPRVAVGAIIVDKDARILTCRRPHGPENYVGKLHTFGGKVDLGETLYDAIVREVREECNIDVTKQAWKTDMVGMIEEIEPDCNFQVDGQNQMYHWVSAIWVFWLRDSSFKNMEPHKHLDMRFRDVEELDPLDLAPSAYHSLVLAGLFEPREDWHNVIDREQV